VQSSNAVTHKSTSPDGAASGITPATAGVEEMTTGTEPITLTPTTAQNVRPKQDACSVNKKRAANKVGNAAKAAADSPIPTPKTTATVAKPDLLEDMEHDGCDFGSVAAAHNASSSELNSYESIPLEDLTQDQVCKIAQAGDFAVLHSRSKEIGLQVMKFVRFFERYKPIVVAIKTKFGVRRGSHARMEVEPGIKLTWAEYCQRFYGVSYRWVEKQINGDYVPIENEDGAEAARSANQESDEDDPDSIIEKKTSKNDKTIAHLQRQVDDLTAKLKASVHDADDRQRKLVDTIHTPRALWSEMNKSDAWIDALDNVFMIDSEKDFAARVQEFGQLIADGFRKGFKVEVNFDGKGEGGE